MNKTSVKLIAALAGLICLYSLLSFFRVSGAELPGLSTLSPETCTVKIFEAPWEDPSDQTEHLLNEEQILQLKELLAKSTFTRFLRSGSPVQIAGGTRLYTVCFYFDDPEDFFYLRITGNEYLSSTALANGKELKIVNRSAWKNAFEAILAE